MALTPASPQRGRPKPPLIDEWSIREKLALASSVSKSGDQNWHSTSRPLRGFAEANRPSDWFSQKNCALQYEDMLEKVEQPKRKRGERGEETAQDVIVRDLTQKRIEECQKLIAEGSANIRRLRVERQLLDSENPPVELMKEIWMRIKKEEAEAKAEEIRHQEWLKERDQKIAAAKIATRHSLLRTRSHPPVTPTPVPPAIVIKTEETSQPATSEAHDESSTQSVSDSTAPTTPAAQNPPLTSPLLTSLLQSPTAGSNTPLKEENKDLTASPSKSGAVFFSTTALNAAKQLVANTPAATATSASPTKGSADDSSVTVPSSSPTLNKLLELPLSSASANKLPPLPGSEQEEEDVTPVVVEKSEVTGTDDSNDTQLEDAVDATRDQVMTEVKEEEKSEDKLRSDGKSDEQQEAKTPLTRRQRELRGRPSAAAVTPTVGSKTASVTPAIQLKGEPTSATQVLTPAATPANTAASSSAVSVVTRRSGRIRGNNREVSESESSLPEKKSSLPDDLAYVSASEESLDAPPRSNVPSKAPSLSDSIPNSPASTMHSEDTDTERERRRWQKSILGLVKLASTHRYAASFMHPAVKEVKDYDEAVKRPVDLKSIKHRVENQAAENAIRTTAEFQRDMMLLFQNAIMYNKKGHDVSDMAVEMRNEILEAIEAFVESEKQAAYEPPPPTTGGKTSSTTETPVTSKQRIRERRTGQDDAASRRRSRTSTDTDPGTSGTSVPLTRTALKKKATG